MNITLEITSKVQKELARQASLTGRGMEMHAASLLEEALHLSPSEKTSTSKEHPAFGKDWLTSSRSAR